MGATYNEYKIIDNNSLLDSGIAFTRSLIVIFKTLPLT